MVSNIVMEAAGRTHVGYHRQRNEDSFYQGPWLSAVADGLGGHAAGDIASSTAIDVLSAYDRPFHERDLANHLGQAINRAGDALRRRMRNEPSLTGMGTTMVAVLRSGCSAVLGNIGDSRAYRVRHGAVTQVSEDHTYQHLVSAAETVPELPGKLARFLDGRKDGRSPDLTTLQLQPGERLLLCSDGLSSYVSPSVIAAILTSPGVPAKAADTLIAAALDAGGHDNVTVIVLDVREG